MDEIKLPTSQSPFPENDIEFVLGLGLTSKLLTRHNLPRFRGVALAI